MDEPPPAGALKRFLPLLATIFLLIKVILDTHIGYFHAKALGFLNRRMVEQAITRLLLRVDY